MSTNQSLFTDVDYEIRNGFIKRVNTSAFILPIRLVFTRRTCMFMTSWHLNEGRTNHKHMNLLIRLKRRAKIYY